MICNNPERGARKAAELIIEQVKRKPDSVLGLATGNTVVGIYKEIANDRQLKNTDWSKVVTFNLDEYVGLPGKNTHSYRYFMDAHLFTKLNIDQEKTFVPLGTGDLVNEPVAYETLINKHGGIDLQLLGIGVNGHIGFNEPGSSFGSRTRVVSLSDSTVEVNKANFEKASEMPTRALTLGLATIMSARRIVLVAFGASKADAIKGLLEGRQTESLPASVLQSHPDVTVIADKAALSKVKITLMGRMSKHVTYDFKQTA